MSVTTKYRKKPVVVEARVLTEDNMREIQAWISEGDEWAWIAKGTQTIPAELYIETLEGPMHASLGDFVIKGLKGEFYACKPDIFEMTYEPA